MPFDLICLVALCAGPPLPSEAWAKDHNVYPVLEQLARARRARHVPRMSYLDNGTLRLGVDLSVGGAITFLAPSMKDENLINSYDWGRQVQMSSYSGPAPMTWGPRRPFPAWAGLGWNPVQAGDHFGHASRVLEHRNDGKRLYVRCVPMLWPLADVPAECTFETWITLEGDMARVRCRLNLARGDRTPYPARDQEMPAVYTNGPYYRVYSYTGDRPFTKGRLTRIVKKRKEAFPWSSFHATEGWAALVDDRDRGLGVLTTATSRYLGGFAGKPGKGGPADFPTGYIAPIRPEVLDHDGAHEYEYALVVGTLETIRARAARFPLPAYVFTKDRQGWTHGNASDRWPIRGELDVTLRPGAVLIGPPTFFRAEEVGALAIEAAMTTKHDEARLYWATLDEPTFTAANSVGVPITGDGVMRRLVIDLRKHAGWKGGVVRLRFDPVTAAKAGDRARIRSIGVDDHPRRK